MTLTTTSKYIKPDLSSSSLTKAATLIVRMTPGGSGEQRQSSYRLSLERVMTF